ncbi:hypothetical protein M758_5G100400 [Ceratodon purpureus]|nr:hypothetical protein M758_5G100400 [Ceratodon purpureus]
MGETSHQLVMTSHRKQTAQLDAIRSAPTPVHSAVPAASPRIQSMMQRRGEFDDQLEFEIEASKDHWSELESKIAVNQGEAEDKQYTDSKIVRQQQQFQILGRFRRQLGELLFCCKCESCSVFSSSNHEHRGNQVESVSILGRFRRRLGRLFLCWQCGTGCGVRCGVGCGGLNCGMPDSSPQQQGNHDLECVELEEAEDSEGEETNREIFESLKKQWGGFFSAKWGDNLELGPKIAEGGQAEIFEVEGGIDAVRMEFVVKAFKKGYSLRSLQIQWPLGMLQNTSPEGHFNLAKSAIIFAGTVLKDDRFAFVMHKYWGDLRKLIDLKMQHRHSHGPPFREHQAVSIMLQIANGMEQLHKKKIPHRDLKASNILIALDMAKRNPPDPRHDATEFSCVIADYECSYGVVGTGFWRAPEVLVAVKDQTLSPSTFTQEADVYSFGMTSYEILTGWVPFEELGPDDYDAVVRGRRPQLPHPMNSRVTELLCRCWHSNPAERPSFEEIGFVLETVKRSYVHADSSSSPDSRNGL